MPKFCSLTSVLTCMQRTKIFLSDQLTLKKCLFYLIIYELFHQLDFLHELF